jgi:hypothetical protein
MATNYMFANLLGLQTQSYVAKVAFLHKGDSGLNIELLGKEQFPLLSYLLPNKRVNSLCPQLHRSGYEADDV